VSSGEKGLRPSKCFLRLYALPCSKILASVARRSVALAMDISPLALPRTDTTGAALDRSEPADDSLPATEMVLIGTAMPLLRRAPFGHVRVAGCLTANGISPNEQPLAGFDYLLNPRFEEAWLLDGHGVHVLI